MEWSLKLIRRARRQLNDVHGPDLVRLHAAIDALALEPRPHGFKPLKGTGACRVRVGDWRVIYTIFDDAREVVVISVVRRNEGTYRGL